MTLRIPIVTEKKHAQPDYPIQPYVPRSADAYEKHNTKNPNESGKK